MKYLLDTNVLSEPLKLEPNPKVMSMLKRHQDEIATAALVWHELLFGCLRLPQSRKREMIAIYLEEVVLRNMDIYHMMTGRQSGTQNSAQNYTLGVRHHPSWTAR